MIILGLHFGHDATIYIIKDGVVIISVEVERINRIKHSIGIDPAYILQVANDCAIDVGDIDFCTLTTTQGIEYILSDKDSLDIMFKVSPKHNELPCVLTDKLKISSEEFIDSGWGFVHTLSEPEQQNHFYQKLISPKIKKGIEEKKLFGGFENFIWSKVWEKRITLEDIANTDYDSFLNSDDTRHGFHYPCVVKLFGKEIPSYFFAHHYAHISYSYYSSNFDDSAVISCDGDGNGHDYKCGFFAYGKKNKLFPVTPHYLSLGPLHTNVPLEIGFDLVGGAGKMMGLSAYGKPRFFEHKFVGNWFENKQLTHTQWINHCKARAADLGYDMKFLGDKNHILEPINVDIAASTQKLTEEIMLHAGSSIKKMLNFNKIETKNLCLSGGLALNCPANTRLYNEGPFEKISVPPGIADSGLSTGSAMALYYNIMDNSRLVAAKENPAKTAYLGLHSSSSEAEIKKYLKQYEQSIVVVEKEAICVDAAKNLQENKIIAWFDGRSELGPRALGHRSIIANSSFKENWQKVNAIKSREFWRPFAPIVLERLQGEYFFNSQLPSYYMLLNAQVKSNKIPAVTHVDGSARVQSVNENNGSINNLLEEFYKVSGLPVLMNTSFNGPGEPVIETVEQAIKFLLNTDLDFLYVSNRYQISKKA